MFEDFAFVLMHHGETSQLICGADDLSEFYLVHGIERNIVIFKGLLCIYLIVSFLSVIFLCLTAIIFLLRGVFNYFFSKMPVNPVQYREAVGVFDNHKFFNRRKYEKMFEPTFFQLYLLIEHCFLPCNIVVSLFMLLAALIYVKPKMNNVATISAFALFFVTCVHLWTVNWVYSPPLILLSGDVEINPGTRYNCGECFPICHWNLNSVPAYNYTKLSLLKAFVAVYKFDINCLPETYLDSSVAPDDDNFEISGYSLVRSNHPANNKREGVCVCYKKFLPLRVLDIQYLHECINFELKISDKICNILLFIDHLARHKTNLKNFPITFN